MVPEADKPDSAARGQAGPAVGQAKTVSKARAGVPIWRTGKPDAFLAAAVDTARAAIEGITAASDIGRHVAAKSEGDRLVTHLFESRLPGYVGWHWYAVLTRNSRSKVVTVNELGLLPSEDSILAPEWVPWAERVRPEDAQEQDAQEQDAREQEVQEQAAGEASGLDAEADGPGQEVVAEPGEEAAGVGKPSAEAPDGAIADAAAQYTEDAAQDPGDDDGTD